MGAPVLIVTPRVRGMRDEMGWDRACHFSFWCELGFALGFRFWVAEGSRLLEGWDEVDEKAVTGAAIFSSC
jgi:hypothetical protein